MISEVELFHSLKSYYFSKLSDQFYLIQDFSEPLFIFIFKIILLLFNYSCLLYTSDAADDIGQV